MIDPRFWTAAAVAMAAIIPTTLWLGVRRVRGIARPNELETIAALPALLLFILWPAALGPGWLALPGAVLVAVGIVELRAIHATRWLPTVAIGAISLVWLGATANGFGNVVFLIACIEFCDSFAWVFGRLLGRTPLAPTISPNKTVEGAAGGVVVAAVVAALPHDWLPGTSIGHRVLLGIVLAVAAVGADLLASRLKRAQGVKDFGTRLPGIGGVLDAYDTLILVAPLWCLLVTAGAAG